MDDRSALYHSEAWLLGTEIPRTAIRATSELVSFPDPDYELIFMTLSFRFRCVLPISPPFEHRVLRERVRSLNLLRDSLRKVNRYVGTSK